MSVVTYKCTVCARTAEITENPYGLDRVDRCNITNHCTGRLSQVGRKREYSVGKTSEPLDGVENWVKRNVFYEHKQLLAKTTWFVNHNLSVNPSVQVFIRSGNRVTTEADPDTYTVRVINKDSIEIIFNTTNTGIVHCVARDSSNKTNSYQVAQPQAATVQQLTTSFARPSQQLGELSLAINHDVAYDNIRLAVEYVAPTGASVTRLYDSGATGASWSDALKVSFSQKYYTVKSYSLSDPYLSQGDVVEASRVHLAGFAFKVANVSGANLTLVGDQTWRFRSGQQFSYRDPTTGAGGSIQIDSVVIQVDPAQPLELKTLIIGMLPISNPTLLSNIVVAFDQSEAFILYADSPYESDDKHTTHVVGINPSRVTQLNSFLLVKGQLVVGVDKIARVYPDIFTVI